MPRQVGLRPDVLADRDADAPAQDFHRRIRVGRLEVARLVEDIVGRQQGLAHDATRVSALEHGGGIVKRLAGRGRGSAAR